MAKRSPVLGYNHNFKHRGLIFHVQTEDSGVDNPHIFTHLFHGGVIISSRKMNYDADSDEDVVKSLMQSQHKAVLKDLKIGTFDDKIDAYLGNNPDLLPRKNAKPKEAEDSSQAQVDEAAQKQAAAQAQQQAEEAAAAAAAEESSVARAATEEDLREAAERAAAEQAAAMGADTDDMSAVAKAIAARVDQKQLNNVEVGGDTDDLSEIARAAQRAAQEKLAAAEAARKAAEAAMAEAQAAAAAAAALVDENGAAPSGEQEGDTAPVASDTEVRAPRRARVPTPMSVPVAVDQGIGDPVVTFSAAPGKGQASEDQSSGVPAAPVVGESSGAYHMGRRQSRATMETIQAPRSQGRAAPAGGKPAGKAANPAPGRAKSSVNVARPAVIIGGPARVVGGKKKPAGKKPRASKGIFGKDLISEKSLDEVIMAYLSEDSNDD